MAMDVGDAGHKVGSGSAATALTIVCTVDGACGYARMLAIAPRTSASPCARAQVRPVRRSVSYRRTRC